MMTRFPDARQRGSLITARKSDSDSESRRLAEPESESRDYTFSDMNHLVTDVMVWARIRVHGVREPNLGHWRLGMDLSHWCELGSESLVRLRRRAWRG